MFTHVLQLIPAERIVAIRLSRTPFIFSPLYALKSCISAEAAFLKSPLKSNQIRNEHDYCSFSIDFFLEYREFRNILQCLKNRENIENFTIKIGIFSTTKSLNWKMNFETNNKKCYFGFISVTQCDTGYFHHNHIISWEICDHRSSNRWQQNLMQIGVIS